MWAAIVTNSKNKTESIKTSYNKYGGEHKTQQKQAKIKNQESKQAATSAQLEFARNYRLEIERRTARVSEQTENVRVKGNGHDRKTNTRNNLAPVPLTPAQAPTS